MINHEGVYLVIEDSVLSFLNLKGKGRIDTLIRDSCRHEKIADVARLYAIAHLQCFHANLFVMLIQFSALRIVQATLSSAAQ